MPIRKRIRAFYPNFFGDNLIAYVSLRILMYFNTRDIAADVMGISSEPSVRDFRKNRMRTSPSGLTDPVRRRVYRDAIPPGPVWSVARRLFPKERLERFAERRFLRSLRSGDIVYLWPSASLSLHREVKRRGYTVITERINTLVTSSKRILDGEFAALGLPEGSHGLTAAGAEDEIECMGLSDFIFSPSPAVTRSLLEAGFSRSKILESSYGLRDTEILPPRTYGEPKAEEDLTAIFVGTVCVRKGIHLLLEAWKRSGVRSRLMIVGRVSPEAKDLLAKALAENPRISHLDFLSDLKPVYAGADFFVLTSLEEGSPLVTYLAFGASLPLIVSPMGAGGVVDDGVEGLVKDPHDLEGLAGAIRTMAADGALRERMSRASGAKAAAYTWDRVALSRLRQLRSVLP